MGGWGVSGAECVAASTSNWCACWPFAGRRSVGEGDASRRPHSPGQARPRAARARPHRPLWVGLRRQVLTVTGMRPTTARLAGGAPRRVARPTLAGVLSAAALIALAWVPAAAAAESEARSSFVSCPRAFSGARRMTGQPCLAASTARHGCRAECSRRSSGAPPPRKPASDTPLPAFPPRSLLWGTPSSAA